MSTSKATSSNNLASTRQMLDELDALMERMLALPVNDLDDVPLEPPQRPALAATLTVLEEPQSSPALEGIAGPQNLYRDANEPESQAEHSYYQTSELGAPADAPIEPPRAPESPGFAPGPNYDWPGLAKESTSEAYTAPIIRPRSTTVLVPFRKPRRSLSGWLLSPLVRFNLAFDRWISRLGWAGAWTRRPWGRLALGLAGLALMLGAIGWVLYDWSNWTR